MFFICSRSETAIAQFKYGTPLFSPHPCAGAPICALTQTVTVFTTAKPLYFLYFQEALLWHNPVLPFVCTVLAMFVSMFSVFFCTWFLPQGDTIPPDSYACAVYHCRNMLSSRLTHQIHFPRQPFALPSPGSTCTSDTQASASSPLGYRFYCRGRGEERASANDFIHGQKIRTGIVLNLRRPADRLDALKFGAYKGIDRATADMPRKF